MGRLAAGEPTLDLFKKFSLGAAVIGTLLERRILGAVPLSGHLGQFLFGKQV